MKSIDFNRDDACNQKQHLYLNHNYNASRFPVAATTVCDDTRRGRIVSLSISNIGTAERHRVHLEMLAANTPCQDKCCDHQRTCYRFEDGNGFFWANKCVEKYSPRYVQHDKDGVKPTMGFCSRISISQWQHGIENKKNLFQKGLRDLIWILTEVTGWWGWQMIICKRLVPRDDYLQEAGPYGWLFTRDRSLWIIICKRQQQQQQGGEGEEGGGEGEGGRGEEGQGEEILAGRWTNQR